MERWRRRGHSVEILTSDFRVEGVANTALEPGVHRLLKLYVDVTNNQYFGPPFERRLSTERANRAALRQVVRGFRPQVASIWNMGGMSLGLLSSLRQLGAPCVLVVCDVWPTYAHHADAWVRGLLPRPVIARIVHSLTGLPTGLPELDSMERACFVSEFLLSEVRSLSPWNFPNAEVVHAGIDNSNDLPARVVESRPWSWRLLCLGRLDPCKGVDTVVRALSSCPQEATLVVHGRGAAEYRRELEELAQKLGLSERVVFSGSDRELVGEVYRQADVLVFASACGEGFGLVPLEAMAWSVPVVATRDGGSAEYLTHELNCLAFEAGDDAGLAASLARLAADPELRAALVAGGLATAREMTVDRQADGLARAHEAAARER